jgi:uncharacterized protein (DUF427 family)
MAVSLSDHLMGVLPELRFQPSPKRVLVRLDGEPVADTLRPMLVWEPKRIVASYAVPESDISATLTPAETPAPQDVPRGVQFGRGGPPLLDPSVPFDVHSSEGERLTVRAGDAQREAAAFRLHDADLTGYVVLDFDAFDWWEEEEPIVGHPRDPLHRIDIRRSSRSVRIEHEGVVLAETDRAKLLFEGTFPMPRYYLPREDVRVELRPGTIDTTCAYKGHATHWTAVVGEQLLPNIAWSYEDPLDDARDVAGMVCFYQERLDFVVDGQRLDRPRTPWS